MAQSKLLLEYNEMPKQRVEVASNISLTDLKQIAAKKFSITQPVTLEYFDADFKEWAAVSDDYQLPSIGKLRVTVQSAEANNVTHPESPKVQVSAAANNVTLPESPKWVPYCTEPASVEQTDSRSDVSRPSGAQGAWMQTDKMWDRERDNPLKILFLNPEVLEDEQWMCGESLMNVDNVYAWARRWNSKALPHIPNFSMTNSAKKAHIRVRFGGGGCWSKVGKDARSVVDKTQPTMNLDLKGQNPDFQEYLVIHEFGHSLGLEHEHQRSDFWTILKDFIDLNKMKNDPQLTKVNLDVDMLVKPPSGETSVYDPQSVMHYWFDVHWLKDKKHWTLEGVKADRNLKAGSKEMTILEGIHERNKSFKVDGPSKLDLEFTEKCYGGTPTTPSTEIDQQPPDEEPTGTILSVNKHLRHVKNALLEAAYQWKPIGEALDLTPGTLKSIGRSHRDDDNECLNEVLSKWMHSGKATMAELLEALEEPGVKRGDIVTEIQALEGEKRSRVGL